MPEPVDLYAIADLGQDGRITPRGKCRAFELGGVSRLARRCKCIA